MIVCHCTGITDRHIQSEVKRGAATCRDVARRCQAGAHCGGCVPLVRELIHGRGHARPTASMGPLSPDQ